jgi:hypothetical protein
MMHVAEKIDKIKTTLNKYPCMIRVSGSLGLGLHLFCVSTNTLVFCPSFYTISYNIRKECTLHHKATSGSVYVCHLAAALLDKWAVAELTSGKTFSSQNLFPHFLPSSKFEF